MVSEIAPISLKSLTDMGTSMEEPVQDEIMGAYVSGAFWALHIVKMQQNTIANMDL